MLSGYAQNLPFSEASRAQHRTAYQSIAAKTLRESAIVGDVSSIWRCVRDLLAPGVPARPAQKRWRALNGAKLLADVIDGVVFEDGVRKEAA